MVPQAEFVTVNVVVPELDPTLRLAGLTESVGAVFPNCVSVTVSGVPVAPGPETSMWQFRDEQSLFSL